jgi:HK97 family phage prohead protease
MDELRWDGAAAMQTCSTAADFRSIAFERNNDSAPDTAAHWALPHHPRPGATADPQGVSAALAALHGGRGGRPNLKDPAAAEAHLQRHSAAEKGAELPREDLYRGMWPADFSLREADGSFPVMFGHFAVFNEWTHIDSVREGSFMEQLAPGSFEKTFEGRGSNVRSLFQHGHDPYIGSKVLGPVDVLREDERGAYYEVPLLDTSYNRDLLPGLRAGLYGASFRFRVMREEILDKPARSEHNPEGLPERTIKEVELHEFGPVTFPAYASATAGIRSLTDEFVLYSLTPNRERLREIIRYIQGEEPLESDAADRSDGSTSDESDAVVASVPGTSAEVRKPTRDYLTTRKPKASWVLEDIERK